MLDPTVLEPESPFLICSFPNGDVSLIPTLPPSFIVKTSVVLSNTFTKSAVPVPLMYTAGLLLLSVTIAKSPLVLWKL